MVVLRPGWLWRREWLCLAVVAGAAVNGWLWLREWAGYAGLVAGALPILLVLVVPPLRRTVAGELRRGRLVRAWDAGCRFAGLATTSDRVPRIVGPVTWAEVGETFRVRMPKGAAAEDLANAAERVAVVLRARAVVVEREATAARYASVRVQRVDPFADRPPDVWPWLHAPRVDFSGPVPVGLSEARAPVTVRMPGKNLIAAGEPEAGKSVAASQIIAAAALDPNVRIYGWDAKQVELSLWAPVMEKVAYNDMETAIANLRELVSGMDSRYAAMAAAGRRTATAEDGPVYLAVFDELRFFTAHEDAKLRKEFNGLLVDLIARGRAARYVTLAATQKPSSDVIPTSIRDLVGYRWALRCTTKDASDTVLCAGMAGEGYDASTIPIGTRGVGLLHAEGGFPQRIRAYYLTDADVAAIAARGAALRAAS